ncbi:MAG TPA: hypothetical protein VM032_08335, partial [Vicinamibacterales bacterium]|nr:hypothetical protein [Vicinamibacterales bacterium]
TFTRKVALFALLLPATLVAQGAGQPSQAQLKARAELARQRALQQQAQQTKAPATAPANAAATKTATPQTKTGAPTTTATVPQTKTTPAPQTKTVTPPAPQTKTAAAPPVPVPQTKTAVPQTKTATVPPPAPQTKAAPAGSAIAAGQQQTGAPRLQPKPPAEVTFNREVFAYVKGNRRDPFTTMITSSDLRPQITDLKLVTVIHSQVGSNSVAIMRDLTTNEQYRVRVGQTLGRMRVAQIQQRAVVFSIEEFGYNRQEVVSMDDSTRARTP